MCIMLVRMKQILLDLVEVTRAEIGGLDDQLVDFGVVAYAADDTSAPLIMYRREK